MFLRIVEFALLAVVVYMATTQIAIPAILGRRLFPAFRRTPDADKADAMRDQVGDLEEQVEAMDELAKLQARQANLKRQLEPEAAPSAESQPERK